MHSAVPPARSSRRPSSRFSERSSASPRRPTCRMGTRAAGLRTNQARTLVTRPTVRTSSRVEPGAHHGLPTVQPNRVRSGAPRSGLSSASGAAVRHGLHAPEDARVRSSTRPLPRQCTPTRSNRLGLVNAAGERAAPSERSRLQIDASAACAAAGAASRSTAAIKNALITGRVWRNGARRKGAPGVALQGRRELAY